MSEDKPKTMRDVFIEQVYLRMFEDKNIFFLCADFGSPMLDKLRNEFTERFLNVGIAEQNLINVASGLALEGFVVYAYAISPFLTMRAYEQIRNNLSLLSKTEKLNVNLVGVGAGLSYDVSGPTHHCLEDLAVMRVLPNIEVFSASDWFLAKMCAQYSFDKVTPKYFRFDASPVAAIYDRMNKKEFARGYCELIEGKDTVIVSTGFMTHTGLRASRELKKDGIDCGIIDVFRLKPVDADPLFGILSKYDSIITVEEGFIDKGGLDTVILNILAEKGNPFNLKRLGFGDRYIFELGGREYLHRLNGLDASGIVTTVKQMLTNRRD